MIRAVDSEGNDVLIWSANIGEQYYCPLCNQPLIQRRGEIREHHFAHYGSKEGFSSTCSDRWNYDKTEWHINWQKRFPDDCCEKIISSGGKKHIADVQINSLVIEFQHSAISLDEFRERNTFYTNAGFNVIWVFDLVDLWEEGKIKVSDEIDNKYTWAYAKKGFRNMEVRNEKATIYFQFSDDDDPDSGVLERVTGGYKGFSQFYTDLSNALSISEFVKKAKEMDTSLIPKKKKKYQELPNSVFKSEEQPEQPIPVPNGSSVFKLWKSSYAFMIVQNLCNNKTMIIFGNNGEMEHQSDGKIIGKYKNDGVNNYSSQKYVVWDAKKDIWTLIYSKNR